VALLVMSLSMMMKTRVAVVYTLVSAAVVGPSVHSLMESGISSVGDEFFSPCSCDYGH